MLMPVLLINCQTLILFKMKNYQETNVITEVTEGKNTHTISMNGLCCGINTSYGILPKVGDKLTVHTKGGAFGTIRGMDLNGEKIFWKTDEEMEAERLEWLRKNEEEKQEIFKENVAEMDKQYDSLPKCFQERIDKFRANNDRFRIDYESYELFCCEQAILIANACKTPEAVKEFGQKKWEEQLKQVPELSDGHSGNTFGAACHLAFWYLSNAENVVKMHGALSPLVGSAEYGDIART
jgi:hypothetical protein